MKKYGNNKIVLTFLQNAYKSLGVPGPYAKLIRNTMWEWFTKEGELKENYMETTQHGTTMKTLKQNLPKLEEYLEICDEIVYVLQKMKELVSHYQQGLCNPFSKNHTISCSSTH